MNASGVGNLHFYKLYMDHAMYINIVQSKFHKNAEKLGLKDDFIFQQDNDPKYRT